MRLPNPYRPEATVLAHRLAALEGALNWPAVITASAPWVQAVRDNPPPFWAMESLLKEYPISSAEGLALMRLAEALLRVPDAETAMALTADQLGRADFDGGEQASHAAHGDGAHEGISRSTLARLSSSAIALSKKFLPDPTSGEQPGLFTRLGARTVVAATLRSVQLLGRQFVLGQTIADAQKEAASARKKQAGLRFSYDMLGEGARTEADAQAYLASYTHAIQSIAKNLIKTSDRGQNCSENDGISIKLSALHPRYEDAQTQRVLTELVPRVWTLCQQAARANINLTIDAEEVDRLELSLVVFEALSERVAAECPQWSGFGLALQAYQTRALELVAHVIAVARQHRIRLMCRLVKGAYWDAEIKRAQELGLAYYPVFTEKHHTDASYLACARALLAAPDAVYPQFATHNAGTIAAILQMAESVMPVAELPTGGTEAAGVALEANAAPQGSVQGGGVSGSRFELQRLHGMGEGIYREVLKHPAVPCRVYAPVGQHRDLLAYLVRRLLENGANSSFVHQLADESVGMAVLLASPMDQSAAFGASAQPPLNLPLPPDLFGPARRNSTGLDLTVAAHRDPLLAAHAHTSVPVVPEFDAKLASDAYQKSASSYQQWSATPVEQRAAILRAAADALEADTPRFCALLVKEAHKTWGDTVAEVREAVDFLRYYAAQAERIMQPIELPEVDSLWGMSASMGAGQVWGAQDSPQGRPKANQPQGVGAVGATQPTGQMWGPHFKGWGVTGERNTLRLTARGVWVAISPWNFPLAIFLGQVAAALATGNTVLAKPAEQTPAVALEAVRLLHAAGVPADALQLLHGPGETVGAALVALPGVAGVVFTGSTQVAKLIQRALAAKDGPIVPLIAETGGLNAMLVDSTALPEQVADAVVQSAFRSAGQRCSALRLLCVHEAVADGVLHMIAGAAQELCVGDPAELATDVGPLIDAEAFEGISRHLARLKKESKQLLSLDGIDLSAMPNLMPPHMFEVAGVAAVGEEIFGPVLQVLRWGPGCAGLETPEAVVRAINALGAPGGPAGGTAGVTAAATAGYGLTFGIQTRIDSRAQALARAAHIGNVYVNRNMIGAVVGLQPFGGEGLSGTGPKAGGPHYLYRFCAEQTVTINTTAAGGNVALLA